MVIYVRRGKLRNRYAEVERKSDGRYTITLDAKNTPLQNAEAFLHECCHIMCWNWLPFEDENKEHGFIRAMERSFRRHWSKHWRGPK